MSCGEGLDVSDAGCVKDCSDDGNPTAVSCFIDLLSESDEGPDLASVSTAGEGSSCCGSSEKNNEASDCESLSEEECFIGSCDLVDELGAPEGEGVGCVESSAVIDLECVAVEDVDESATLMADAANAADLIPDGICGKDICVVTSDDEVLSCCEIVCAGAVDMPAGIQACQSATSRHSLKAIENLAAWLLENKRRPRRGQAMDGPLRCQVTEEDAVANTWGDLNRRPLSGRSDVPGDVRSRFEQFKKLMREDPERIAAEARRGNHQTSTQRSFERVSVWLTENKRRPMRCPSKDGNKTAQT